MIWLRRIAFLCFASLPLASLAQDPDPFRKELEPFLKSYCHDCHNAKKPSAELNLTKYKTSEQMADDFRQWEHVITFVRSEEMPPDDAKKPTAEQRAAFLKTLEGILKNEAKKLAGDPGVVLPRRLSNAEYNYTIRDLTGVDIRPADSFPVDPASGEGFSNTGEALQMSPGLFKKYYAAAQQVADHIDFTPTGWSFAPYPAATYADQKKLHEQALLDFYARHAVDVEKHLTAAWEFRQHKAIAQDASPAAWAGDQGLSTKYFVSLVNLLEGTDDQFKSDKYYVRWLRTSWREIPKQRAAALPKLKQLSGELKKLSQLLTPRETEAIVSNAGNGPIQHIDRRTKTAATRDTFNTALLTSNRRLRFEFRNVDKQEKLRISLGLTSAATGQPGYVILKNLNFSSASESGYRLNDATRNVALRDALPDDAQTLAKFKFGKHPLDQEIDADSFVLALGDNLEFEIDTDELPDGNTISLYGDAQLDVEHSRVDSLTVFERSQAEDAANYAEFAFPLVKPDSQAAADLQESAAAICRLFPNRFFYVDETRGLSAGFHLIEGFFRDDQPLCKHVLSDAENCELDRLWEELNFGTQIAERMLRGFVFFERSERNFMKHPDFDAFKEEDPELTKIETVQRLEEAYFARSNLNKLSPEEIAKHPIHSFFADIRAGLTLRQEQLQSAQAGYLQQLELFAERAFRRTLTEQETAQMRAFYEKIRSAPEHGVESAVRASLIRILVSPHFCYRADPPAVGDTVQPLSDLALASRLSYFLWSSLPDEELMKLAREGKLRDERVLLAQTRRMLKSPKVTGFALEFFGSWLRYRDFLDQESVSREAFPGFDEKLKQAMFAEPTQFITRLIQEDRPITDLLHSNTTLVNKRLATHYGLPFSGQNEEWVEISGLNAQGRSGLLGMAVFLTKNSQPQRTSPVKRGFWVVHHLLGEHIPPPPPDVVALPAKETDTGGKTIRELLKLHTEDAKCARCHVRFDDVGLSMEGFDAIGRARTKDLAGRAIDNAVALPTGKEVRGVPEFAAFLAANRIDDFSRTMNKKLLGYALGRSLQLSDQPLLDEMQEKLQKNGHRFGTLIETVVASPQFRQQRSRDFSLTAFRQSSLPKPPASGAKP